MNFNKTRRAVLAAVSLVGAMTALAPLPAMAAWPERPITMVVPYPPGGATDVIGRILGQRLSTALGQQVVIENRGGAGGNIGAAVVAKAKPDGYTILMGAITSHSTMATLEKGHLQYDLIKDLQPVMIVGHVPLVFVVHPSVPANNIKELIAYGKANPGKLTYASSGAGAPQRMAAELFKRQAGLEMIHVPYKGSGPAMTDLVGGTVLMMTETAPASLSFVKTGKLRALGVTTAQRISMLPDVPTAMEQGMKDFDVSSTFGVLVPTGTPAPIVDRLNAELAKIMKDPEAQQQMLGQGVYALPATTPAKASERLKQEVARWEKVIHEAKIKADE
jgi:tripartite-type tricarboxylate transporter receptor subunit TctC